MSLDVTLKSNKLHKETCEHCGSKYDVYEYYYDGNITHNLGKMASVAGIYEALWRPEEIRAKTAKDIIPLLEEGLKKLKDNPSEYEKYNAENGWGLYEHFVPFVENYLSACKEHPEREADQVINLLEQ